MRDERSPDSLISTKDVESLRTKYREDGYCVTPALIPQELLDDALLAAEAVCSGASDTGLQPRLYEREREGGPQQLVKIAEPHNASHALRRLITYPPPWRTVAAITDASTLQVWAVDLFIKRPTQTARGNIGWHQDGPFAPYWEGDIFTVWVALSTVTVHSSPLRYVRGSHRLGPLGKTDLFRTDLLAGFGDVPEGFHWDEIAAEVPAGGFAIHHRDMLHASGPNLSDQSRYSLAIRVRTDRAELLDRGGKRVAHLADRNLAPVVFT